MKLGFFALIFVVIGMPGVSYAQDIALRGGSAFPKDEILRVLALNPTGPYSEAELDSGRERLVQFCKRKGYWDANAVIFLEGENFLLRIDEGEPVRFEKVSFLGEMEVREKELADSFPLRKGDVLDADKVESALRETVSFLNERGFLNATVRPSDFIVNGKKVQFTVGVKEGSVFHVGEVTFSAKASPRTSFLRREFGVKHGAIFSYSKLRQAEEKFSRNELYVQSGPSVVNLSKNGPYADIFVPVAEKPAGAFSGGIAFRRASERPSGYLNLFLGNIAGTGRKLRAGWKGNSYSGNELSLSYVEPWLLGFPFSGKLGLTERAIGQEFSRITFSLGVETAFSYRTKCAVSVEKEKTVLGELTGRKNEAISVISEAAVDRRDSPLSPRSGFLAAFHLSSSEKRELGLVRPSPDTWQMRAVDTNLEYNVRLGMKPTLCSRVRYLGVSSNGSLLAYDLPSVGGAKSLRGYREDQFRVRQGLVASLELRFFSGKDGNRTFVFVDSGLLERGSDDRVLREVGYGAGIRANSGLGAIGLDLGFENGRPISEAKIHFTVQETF
ncbi:MAG: POTRA domain-containing protein [Candidatus Eisenbacteria bacterium]|nr:POTRA domain-containing protein [Candidatus Eisenbacteria bacterium]